MYKNEILNTLMDQSDCDSETIINDCDVFFAKRLEEFSVSDSEHVDCVKNDNNLYVVSKNKNKFIEEAIAHKTVFSKMSEVLFKKMQYRSMKENPVFNYEDFICDDRLIANAKKYNGKNNGNSKRIKEFIERSTSKTKKIERDFLLRKKYETSPDLKKEQKASRSITQFLSDQEEFEKKKINRLNEMKSERDRERSAQIKDKPHICLRSKILALNSRNNSTEVHSRLYKMNTSKERQSELMSFSKFFSTSKKPLSKEGNISKELYGRLTEKRKKDKDITYTANTKSTTITNGNASMLVSNESNLILFDRFFSLFEMSLLISTNKSIRDDYVLNNKEYSDIIQKTGMVSIPSTMKENILIQQSFELLSSISNKEGVSIGELLIFLLVVIGINPTTSKVIRNRLSVLKDIDIDILVSTMNQKKVKICYDVFSVNYYDNDAKRRKKNKMRSPPKQFPFEPKKNRRSIKLLKEGFVKRFMTNTNSKERKLKMMDIYNLSVIKKEKEIEEERKKKEKKELSQCTFKPNLRLTKNINKSIERNSFLNINERLYQDGLTSLKKKKHIQKQNRTTLNETFSFSPVLTEYSNKIFIKNPLKEEKLIKDKAEKLKGLREEQKQKKKKIELRSSSNELVEDKAIISNVSFDIDIELTNGMQKLIIHHGQDIIKVVNNFSDENNLTDESKKQIITEVKNNIK